MDLLKLNSTSSSNQFWEFKGKSDYVDNFPLMGTPYPILIILVSYLAFVIKLGPLYMKNKLPFNLSKILVTYNAVQILISWFLFYSGFKIFLKHGLVRKECILLNDKDNVLLDLSYFYVLAKITELLDTIFFVLKKNQRQVSFLHVYHHSIMVLLTWIAHKYEQNENFLFLATLNSGVHVIMYTYYGLSAYPSLQKYLWWKKYITKMQLIQFITIFVHLIICRFVSDCPPSMGIFYFALGNMLLFYYLFNNFYKQTYIKPTKKDVNGNFINNNDLKSKINGYKHEDKIKKMSLNKKII